MKLGVLNTGWEYTHWTYTANAVAEGKLNPEYTKTAPGGVNRTVSTQPTATRIYSTVQ